jgi:hypothetical protein
LNPANGLRRLVKSAFRRECFLRPFQVAARDAMAKSRSRRANQSLFVMAGLDPAIHLKNKGVRRRPMDARVKPGHDE